jgi:hypothetical protein
MGNDGLRRPLLMDDRMHLLIPTLRGIRGQRVLFFLQATGWWAFGGGMHCLLPPLLLQMSTLVCVSFIVVILMLLWLRRADAGQIL